MTLGEQRPLVLRVLPPSLYFAPFCSTSLNFTSVSLCFALFHFIWFSSARVTEIQN